VELRKATGLTRATLLNVLGVRTGPLANTVALRELSGNDPDVQKAALKILARTGGATELGPLLAALPRLTGVADEAGAALASVLGRIENPAARSGPVVDALQTADAVELRTLLMSALPVCDTDRALDAARRSLSDPDPAVQKAAVRALAEWPTMAAWDSLLAVFQQPGNETQRSLALNGLTRLLADENARPSAALFGRYAQLFSAARGDADIRLVLGALGGAASPDALALAYPLLERSAVHPEASAAIKRIAEAIQKDHPQAAREALDKIKPGS
jgi:HEAT repeat protein